MLIVDACDACLRVSENDVNNRDNEAVAVVRDNHHSVAYNHLLRQMTVDYTKTYMHTETYIKAIQESLADAKVSARQQCVYEDP